MADPLGKANLADPWWRLNNLYYIKNKKGKKVKFKPNWAQVILYRNMWYLNIILKARQLGMTTFIQIFMLDRCLFNDDINAGIVAHNREDAEAFFEDKIKFAYNNLPEDLKKGVSADSDTAKMLKFSNGSRIRVGTSLRSGTYQYVHVSEFGKMCAKFPDKAQEVITGTLNTVATGQMIFIESTAEGRYGEFFDMCQTAERMTEMVNQGLTRFTQMDYKFFFYPWWKHPDYVLNEKVDIPEKQMLYFKELREKHDIDLSPSQKAWYVKKLAEQQSLMKQEYPSTPAEAFEKTTEVSIFGQWMKKVRTDGRIGAYPQIRGIPVCTFWDIGRDDYTSIWVGQPNAGRMRFIYFFEARLQDLTYYAEQLLLLREEYGWMYERHYLPHDAKVIDISQEQNLNRKQVLEGAGVAPITVVPKMRFITDGVEEARRKLPECEFDDNEAVQDGIRTLDGFEWQWDQLNQMARKVIVHNWASHGSSAFMTYARGYRPHGGGFKEQEARARGGRAGRTREQNLQRLRDSVINPSTDHIV